MAVAAGGVAGAAGAADRACGFCLRRCGVVHARSWRWWCRGCGHARVECPEVSWLSRGLGCGPDGCGVTVAVVVAMLLGAVARIVGIVMVETLQF